MRLTAIVRRLQFRVIETKWVITMPAIILEINSSVLLVHFCHILIAYYPFFVKICHNFAATIAEK